MKGVVYEKLNENKKIKWIERLKKRNREGGKTGR